MKKILALIGSPRINGNTDMLTRAFLDGAKKAGHEIQAFHLAKLDIQSCRACEACFEGGGCVIKDDMQTIYPAFNEADVIVFAFPLYYYFISSHLKAAIDRLYAEGRKCNFVFSEKECVVLMTAAGKAPGIFDAAVFYFDFLCSKLGWNFTQKLLVNGVFYKGHILKKDALKTAKEMGERI